MNLAVRTCTGRIGTTRLLSGVRDAPAPAGHGRPAVFSRGARGFVALVPRESNPQVFELKPPCADNGRTTETSPQEAARAGGTWSDFTVEKWRSAVYINRAYFGELCADTATFVETIAEHVKLSGRRVSLVEVGCGTGEFVRSVTDNFRTVVGLDFNPNFIDFCKENTHPQHVAKSHFLQGDACKLVDLLKARFPTTPLPGSRGVEFWDDTRIVACVGNTIGIIPEEQRRIVYEQMAEATGSDGVLVMVYWNARWFGDACLNFYHANPQLCGPFDGASVDFSTTTLKTPSQYHSHWTSIEEARSVMEELGLEIISLKEKGKGVFLAARRF